MQNSSLQMADEISSANNSPEIRRKQETGPHTVPLLSPHDISSDNPLNRSISQSHTVRYII